MDLDRLQELRKIDMELRAKLYEIKDLRYKIQVMRKRRARQKQQSMSANLARGRRGSR